MLEPFAIHACQLSFAVLIGVVWACQSRGIAQAGVAAARASFVLGAGYMLMLDNWWPTVTSSAMLAFWVVSAWAASSLAYACIDRVRGRR